MENGQTGEKRVVARVNGKLVGRAPRGSVSKLFYNPDIYWLIHDARGELGETGHAIAADGGGGNGDPSNTLHIYERLDHAQGAVRRWRRLQAIWESCPRHYRQIFSIRYRDQGRVHTGVVGLRGAFGDLSTLAWELGRIPEMSVVVPYLRKDILSRRRKRQLVTSEAKVRWDKLRLLEAGKLQTSAYVELFPETDIHELRSIQEADLVQRLGRHRPNSRDQVIAKLQRRVNDENRQAHLHWLEAEGDFAFCEDLPLRGAR